MCSLEKASVLLTWWGRYGCYSRFSDLVAAAVEWVAAVWWCVAIAVAVCVSCCGGAWLWRCASVAVVERAVAVHGYCCGGAGCCCSATWWLLWWNGLLLWWSNLLLGQCVALEQYH